MLDNREGGTTTGLLWLSERLRNFPPKELKITLDGQDLSGEHIMVEVMNIQHIGPGLQIAPELVSCAARPEGDAAISRSHTPPAGDGSGRRWPRSRRRSPPWPGPR